MTKRHFIYAARQVAALKAWPEQQDAVYKAFCDLFRAFGPNFDAGRFRDACDLSTSR